MKRTTIVIAAIVVASGAALIYHFAGANSEEKPAVVSHATVTAPPGIPSPFASGPTASATINQAAPAPQVIPPSPPPAPPASIPAPIAKALAAARAEAPSRPMTQLAKDWFGCASEDGYNSTLALIRQKSPNSGDHFHGPDADCAPLPTGTHISVMRIDSGSGIAQVSVDETHKIYWTDSGALAGEPKQK